MVVVFSRIQSAADARATTSEKHTHTGTSLRGGRRRPWAGRGREGVGPRRRRAAGPVGKGGEEEAMDSHNLAKRKEVRKSLRVKVISMGNPEVGKSCLIKRYCEKRFVHKYMATIGIDYGVTKVHVRDREVKVNIFDMAGHPFFYEVRNEFYKDTQGALLVFDVGSRDSFDALDGWLAEMRHEMGPHGSPDDVLVVVCANKVETGRRRVVDDSEGRLWAESRGFLYFETSAQTGEGVGDMFQTLFAAIVELCDNGGRRPTPAVTVGFTKEQADAIRRIRNSRDCWEMLGLKPGANRDEINKAYRKLAVLLHPDKSVAPGSEDAFKAIVNARTVLLRSSD